jgi:hypothetical protein
MHKKAKQHKKSTSKRRKKKEEEEEEREREVHQRVTHRSKTHKKYCTSNREKGREIRHNRAINKGKNEV